MTPDPAASDPPRPAGATSLSPGPLLGRESESARLERMLRPGGPVLIAVTGPRGIGKSALIDTVVELVSDRFDGIHHLELPVGSDEDVAAVVRNHLMGMPVPLRPRPHERAWGRSLLVIAHGDQLASSADDLRRLAGEDGSLTIIVESVVPLDADGLGSMVLGALTPSAAAALFSRFADAVGLALGDDPLTRAHVESICSSAGGNPLAIELAARQLPTIPLDALDDLLSGTRRDVGALTGSIDRGLRGAVRTSVRGASEAAQTLLDLLSVFVGAFTIEAVEAVSADLPTPCYDALDELLDLRLLEFEPLREGGRYRLTGLVRAVAADRLTASERTLGAQERHAHHYAALARRAAAAVEDADEDTAHALSGDGYAECLAALRWLTEHDRPRALRLAADLGWEAQRRGENEKLARALVALIDDVAGSPADRRDALIWLVQLDSYAPDAQDKAEVVDARLSEALALARALDEPLPLLMALRTQYLAINSLRDAAAAASACEEGIRRASAIGHTRWVGRFEISLASILGNLRQFEPAAAHAASGLARAVRTDDRRSVVHATLMIHGLPAEAVALAGRVPPLEAVLEIARSLDDVPRESHVLAALALEAIDRGDAQGAASWIMARQRNLRRIDLLNGLTVSAMLGVMLAQLRGDLRDGARLSGAIAAHVEAVLPLAAPKHSAQYRRALDALRDGLGDDEFHRASGEGAALDRAATAGALMDYLAQVSQSPPHVHTPTAKTPTALTARERQVLELLAHGLRNKEIAAELRVTPKSVMHHTVSIYRKLGVRSRAEAAIFATRLGLVPLE